MTAKKADPLTVCPWCSESGEGELCRTHWDEARDEDFNLGWGA